ncbi:hypothetical protein [Pedobacter sp. MC2016-24]|uniref:hypothetical protein n=1 Tax=Pedobacter sp. MC2016-24 TaxID=2780090 RepID=UPI00187E4510|nr:hypothetical protein [Pedobacter sp. MC2016-24]MBE9599926.1 hypothetical protein [Pedobacter sp. MC2016-24]
MDKMKRAFKIAVKDDLLSLNGTEFEDLCSTLLELILKETVTIEGQNLYAKPVKYTGDMANESYNIIGQCGTDEKYFDDPFTKPLSDLKGAITNHPKCKEVYLFSNKVAVTNRISTLTKTVEDLKLVQIVHYYDSDKIGDVIFENLGSYKILKILAYLVRTNDLYRILPDANKLPQHKGDYFVREEESKILKKLDDEDILQIHGLSGIGKSEISISIAERLRDDFDYVFFIEGDYEQNSTLKFEAVRLSKHDHLINLATKLENSRILLVLDNFNQNIKQIAREFNGLNKKKSKCLITSLESSLSKTQTFHLGYLDKVQAEKILNSCSTPPSSEELNHLMNCIGGYPLILNILKANVEDGSFDWKDVILEVDKVHGLSDPDMINKSIANRIIGFVSEKFKKQLAFIKYIEPKNRKINKNFIRFMLGRLPLSDFEKSSLITIQDSIYYDIHQIVLDSINHTTETEPFLSEFEEELVVFLNEQHQKKGFDFYSFMFNHRSFLEQQLNHTRGRLKKSILYSLIQSNDINTSTEKIISKIKAIETNKVDFIDILLLIERYELELYLITDSVEREKTALVQINDLKQILMNIEDTQSKIALQHHIGKIYSKINQDDLALDFFDKVLKSDPSADYAILQITKIHAKAKNIAEVKKNIRFIFDSDEIRRNGSITVLLAFYSFISDSRYSELKKEHIDDRIEDFVIEVKRCLDDKFDQPYELISKLSSSLCYAFPSQFKDLVDSLPEPSNVDTNDKLRFNYAKILSEYFKLLSTNYHEIDRIDKLTETKQKGISYFKSLDLTPFSRREAAKFYLLIGDFQGALSLSKDFDFNDPFQYQTLCKIQRGLTNYDKALIAIDEAIKMGENNKLQDFFLAAFYNDKAETENSLQITNCLDSLARSIELQTNLKEKQLWKIKLESWKNNYH